MDQKVVAAISTAPGFSGIAIVRISGVGSLEVVKRCFLRRKGRFSPRPWRVYYGDIVGSNAETIDECLLTYFRAPHSYTGEDVVELGIHGGTLVAAKVLDRLLECGAALASPGEFTKRAFLNGRIDLSQAEAVMDVIRANSDAALRNANLQLGGALAARLGESEKSLLRVLALIEAQLEFPDLDIPELTMKQVVTELQNTMAVLERLLASAGRGRVARDGYRVVLIGRPNVGKSSLFNYLSGRDQAIVTDIAGTTRDILQVGLNLEGVLVNLFDTAGLREEGDFIEKLGMAKTEQAMREADLLLLLLDASEELLALDLALLEKTKGYKRALVLTKADLPERLVLPPAEQGFRVSVASGDGVGKLLSFLTQSAAESMVGEDSLLLTNVRHVHCIRQSYDALRAAEAAALLGWELEMVAIDVRRALVFLGEVAGQTVSDSLADQIFSQFCIGK